MTKGSENVEQYGILKEWIDSYLSEDESRDCFHPDQQLSDSTLSSNVPCVKSATTPSKFESKNFAIKLEDSTSSSFDPHHQAKFNQSKQVHQRCGIPLSTFLSYSNKNGYFSEQRDLCLGEQTAIICPNRPPCIVSDDENLGESDKESPEAKVNTGGLLFGQGYGSCNVPSYLPSNIADDSGEKYPSKQHSMYVTNQPATFLDNPTGVVSDDEHLGESDKEESTFNFRDESDDWRKMFPELLQYCQEYGHCNFSSHCPSDTKLRDWCTIQRAKYRQRQNGEYNSLTPMRIEMLESIGLDLQSSTTERKTWKDMFTKLKVYKRKYGNCLVPQKFPDDPKLGRWVDKQRHWYKCKNEGRKTSLSQNQIEQMEKIGFVWSINKQQNWAEMFNQLEDYRASHGNCLVSANSKKYSKIGRWVAQQRHHYKRLILGKSSPMSTDTDRIQKLEEIGFAWNLPSRKRSTNS